MSFPSIPGWDGIHPLMVQFAIVLLLVASLFLLVSLFALKTWRTWAGGALLLMTLGTFAAWLAVGSGHAAGQLVYKSPAVQQAITSHEALGIQARNLFTWLTLGMALLLFVPAMMRRVMPNPWRIGAFAVFLVMYLGSTLMIANTAQQGGRLVHDLGVRAMLASAQPPGPEDTGTSAASGGTGTTQRAPAPRPIP